MTSVATFVHGYVGPCIRGCVPPHALQMLLLTLSHYCLDYFSIRHSQTFHYFTFTTMFDVLCSVKLILLNEYYADDDDDDDAYYTEHNQRQRRLAHSKHNSCYT